MVACASSFVEFPKKGFVDLVHIIDQDDSVQGVHMTNAYNMVVALWEEYTTGRSLHYQVEHHVWTKFATLILHAIYYMPYIT